ncbi:MAG: Flp pilus assembly protein CpaB, partial [Burkholderiales bacterium]|nr:Flp pilus assembly protein CpaB [Burkholderiales bacterium]
MKNLKAIVLLALAILAGLGAALYAAATAGGSRISATKVVVAAQDIEPGTKLNAQMLSVAEWPLGSVPAGAFSEARALDDRVVRSGLTRGEPLLDRKLMPVGAQGGLSAVISEGKRAMTVRVNDVVGVAGFALPGNYVDVMVNAQRERGKGQQPEPVSLTVLEHVLVLAVAQEAGRDETKPKVVNAVTLELTPQDAEKLDLARSVGTLSLVLRNQLDKSQVASEGISKDALFAAVQAVQPVAAPAPA